MTFFPIVERELRSQSRHSRTFWVRASAVFISTMIGLGLLSPSFHGVIDPSETGRVLFRVLAGLGFAYAMLAGVFATADCISEEKRDGTLGLLFLTDLTGHDVVTGKLTGRALNPLYGLMATFPILALALLLGGVTAGEFWRTILVLLNTLFLSLAVGTFVSVRSHDGRLAMAGTLLLLAFVTLAPWIVTGLPSAAARSVPLLALPSPATAGLLVFESYYTGRGGAFVAALSLQHGLAWMALVTAAARVRSSWQHGTPRTILTTTQVKSTPAQRRPWLEQNPMLWLARRGSVRTRPALLATLAACGLLMTALTLRSMNDLPLLAVVTAWVLHAIVKVWLAADACRLLHEARHNGALELLLVSPLRQGEIVDGLLAAVKRRFGAVVALLIFVDLFLMWLGATTTATARSGAGLSVVFFVAAGIFLADTYTLTWVGLWQGMKAPTVTRAFIGCVTRVMLVPWLVFMVLSAFMMALNGGDAPSAGLLMVLWFAASYITDGVLCAVSINRVTSSFREMAAQEQSLGFFREVVKFFQATPGRI